MHNACDQQVDMLLLSHPNANDLLIVRRWGLLRDMCTFLLQGVHTLTCTQTESNLQM
jgi:hypothetical protein